LFWLLLKKRWADALLVAGPMAYAIFSLGPMYVELRYVRYAALTYLLAPPVLFSLLLQRFDVWQSRWERRWYFESRGLVGGACSIVLTACAALSVPTLNKLASQFGLSSLISNYDASAIRPEHTLADIAFSKAVPTVQMARIETGLRITSSVGSGYLLSAPLAGSAGVILVRYTIAIESGGLAIGILSRDRSRWISQQAVSQRAPVVNGQMGSVVEPGSAMVVSASSPTGNEVKATIESLDWTLVCPSERVQPIRELFAPQQIKFMPCKMAGTRQNG
jgi:hypothetical protein